MKFEVGIEITASHFESTNDASIVNVIKRSRTTWLFMFVHLSVSKQGRASDAAVFSDLFAKLVQMVVVFKLSLR